MIWKQTINFQTATEKKSGEISDVESSDQDNGFIWSQRAVTQL